MQERLKASKSPFLGFTAGYYVVLAVGSFKMLAGSSGPSVRCSIVLVYEHTYLKTLFVFQL